MRPLILLSTVVLAGCASPSVLPLQQQACAVPAEPWKAAGMAAAGRDLGSAAGLEIGAAVRLSLHPDGEVTYVTLPKGEGEPESLGGLARFSVERAGVYSVGVSEPIWIDVARDGKAIDTVRFGPGGACSGIRKTVSFDLSPGDHVLELSGSNVRTVGVVITAASSHHRTSARDLPVIAGKLTTVRPPRF